MKKYIRVIIIFLGIQQVFSLSNESEIYKTARRYEEQKKYDDAVIWYSTYLKQTTRDTFKDDVALAIARITTDPERKAYAYRKFLDEYKDSPYRFMARYEYGGLLYMMKKISEAREQYYILADEAADTPYAQKALIRVVMCEYENADFMSAIRNIYSLIEQVEDYEDLGTIYYLLGMLLKRQGMGEEATQYFLITAGSFSESEKAPAALLALLDTYSQLGKIGHALVVYDVIRQLYPDAPEHYEARTIYRDQLKNKNTDDTQPEIELRQIASTEELRSEATLFLREEFGKSLLEDKSSYEEETGVESGYYIQFGYYSQEKNAKDLISRYEKEKSITGLFVAPTTSRKSDEVFYRVLAGPYKTREEANSNLIMYKEKHIEALILELRKEYY